MIEQQVKDNLLREISDHKLIRTFYLGDVRGEDIGGDTYRIQGTASVEVEDSHGTIIKIDGMSLTKFANNPVMRFQHETTIGKWTVWTKGDGILRVEGEVSKTSIGVDVIRLIEDKAIKGLSIGFWPLRYDFPVEGDGPILITESELAEVSVVDLPSNLEAWLNSAEADAPLAIRDWQATEIKPEEKPSMDPKEKKLRDEIDALKASSDEKDTEIKELKAERDSQKDTLDRLKDVPAQIEEIRAKLDTIEFEPEDEDPESRSDDEEGSDEETESETETEPRDHGKPKGEGGSPDPDASEADAKRKAKMDKRLMSKQDRDLAKEEGD